MPNRHIGGSLLPSSEPRILQPIVTAVGTLQVKAIPDEDTHGLFDESGELLASHANGYSCHNLAERIAKGNKVAVMEQAIYIIACGGRLTGAGASLINCRLR